MITTVRVRGGWVVWRWTLVISALAVLGCGGGGEQSPQAEDSAVTEKDSLALMADRVDDAFLESVTGNDEEEVNRNMAFDEAETLTREIMMRERPADGWTQQDLDAALRQRRLTVELRSVGSLEEPWLLRLADPLRPATVGRVLLAYPESAQLVRLAVEPFENVYEISTWEDSAKAKMGVAGWSRTRGGLQPTVWIFTLPESEDIAQWQNQELPLLSSTPLSNGGAGAVSFVETRAGRAPKIRVTDAVLPNPLFDECANCPHLQANLSFEYLGGEYVLESKKQRRTPYAAFVAFIRALIRGDSQELEGLTADAIVVDIARDYGFDRHPRRGRWRIAPGANGTNLDETYLRGGEGAYRILMSVQGSNFVVSSISPTEFVID